MKKGLVVFLSTLMGLWAADVSLNLSDLEARSYRKRSGKSYRKKRKRYRRPANRISRRRAKRSKLSKGIHTLRFGVHGVAGGSFVSMSELGGPLPFRGETDLTMGGGAGISGEYKITNFSGMTLTTELGISYFTRNYGYQILESDIQWSSQWLAFQPGVKLYPIRYGFLSAGGYLAQGLGVTRKISTPQSSSEESFSLEDVNLKSTDYGLALGLGADIPVYQTLSVTAEGRYHLPLANLNAQEGSTVNAQVTDIVGLLGVKYGL